MRSPMIRFIALILGLTSFAVAFAEEAAKPLPLAQNGISLLAQPRDDGWDVRFLLAHVVDGARIRYRRLGAEDWRELAETSETVGPLELGPICPGVQVVELEVIAPEGERTGPFRLSFDPEKERIRQARYLLDHVLTNNWVEFNSSTEDQIYAYFNTVWSRKDALRSIRYSLDSCDLDRTLEAEYGPITSRFTYLCIQLVYADGVASPPRIFFQQRPGANRRRPSRPTKPTGPKSMTPPEPGSEPSAPVRLKTSRANNGWTLMLEVDAPSSVAEYRYRLETDTAWRSTGDLPGINPALGSRSASSQFVLDPLRVTVGRQKIEAELIGTDGAVSGPYTLWFDPDEEILAAARADLGNPERTWGSFEEANDRVPFYLAVFDARDSLSEIRYSVDDCGVGQKFEFPPWNDIAISPHYPDNTIIWMPKETAFACVQLVFTDGTVSEVRRFENVVVEEDIKVDGE